MTTSGQSVDTENMGDPASYLAGRLRVKLGAAVDGRFPNDSRPEPTWKAKSLSGRAQTCRQEQSSYAPSQSDPDPLMILVKAMEQHEEYQTKLYTASEPPTVGIRQASSQPLWHPGPHLNTYQDHKSEQRPWDEHRSNYYQDSHCVERSPYPDQPQSLSEAPTTVVLGSEQLQSQKAQMHLFRHNPKQKVQTNAYSGIPSVERIENSPIRILDTQLHKDSSQDVQTSEKDLPQLLSKDGPSTKPETGDDAKREVQHNDDNNNTREDVQQTWTVGADMMTLARLIAKFRYEIRNRHCYVSLVSKLMTVLRMGEPVNPVYSRSGEWVSGPPWYPKNMCWKKANSMKTPESIAVMCAVALHPKMTSLTILQAAENELGKDTSRKPETNSRAIVALRLALDQAHVMRQAGLGPEAVEGPVEIGRRGMSSH